MEKSFKSFIFKTLIAAGVLFLVGFAFFSFYDVAWYNHGFIFVLLAYLIFSWGVQYTLFHYAKKRIAVFNRSFMIVTGLKLIILIAAMVLIAFLSPLYFKYFLGEILLLYMVFSILEIQNILKMVKPRKNKKN